jgi:phospholipase C
MRTKVALSVASLFAVLGSILGCASHAESSGAGVLPMQAGIRATDLLSSHIKHVVIIVQENRSFDNIFAGFPGSDSQMYGYMSNGTRVPLHQITFIRPAQDLAHGFEAAYGDYNGGKMNAFDLGDGVWSNGIHDDRASYAYLERSEVQPYWQMAQQYVLADHMFPTMFGGSFTAHLDLIATTANISPRVSEVDFPEPATESDDPEGCDAPDVSGDQTRTYTLRLKKKKPVVKDNGPFPCFTQFETIADELDAKNVTWKYYAPPMGTLNNSPRGGFNTWSEYDAIKNVRYGPDWNNNVVSASPETNVLTDVASGKLPDVSWVIPDVANSDHATSAHDTGPSWVGTVVNAIGKSQYWDTTAIIVLWDDWGGWYDNVAPPQKDFRGLGLRVPCIIISPYVKPHVSHIVYEFGSVLKFAEAAFGLGTLEKTHTVGSGYTDERAESLVDDFDFTQAPRAFVPIATKYPAIYFLHERHSYKAPDNE